MPRCSRRAALRSLLLTGLAATVAARYGRAASAEDIALPITTIAIDLNGDSTVPDSAAAVLFPFRSLDAMGKPLACLVRGSAAVTAGALHQGSVKIGVKNGGDTATQVQLEIRLPDGLWRFEAAIAPAGESGASAARIWRMQSALVRAAGDNAVVKRVTVQPGERVYLRATDTVAAVETARRAVYAACGGSPRVRAGLRIIDDSVENLSELVARGDRAKIVKRVHTALLATAIAQAQWRNGRDASLADRDQTLDTLLDTLSEVSCAAYGLLPGQSVQSGVGGEGVLRVSLTNAGTHTLPSVRLGIASVAGSAAAPGGDAARDTRPGQQKAFAAVAPGARVAADFSVADPLAARGVVEYILGTGAALLSACPAF